MPVRTSTVSLAEGGVAAAHRLPVRPAALAAAPTASGHPSCSCKGRGGPRALRSQREPFAPYLTYLTLIHSPSKFSLPLAPEETLFPLVSPHVFLILAFTLFGFVL